jgi:TRAP-type C4-dicarboxylate transport system substrate-binding protein
MKKLLFAMALLMAMAYPAHAQTVIRFALPTPEAHPRNKTLSHWASAVAALSKGQMVIALRHGVTDYSGSRLSAAVAEGAYDMAAPGWWHVSRFAPDFGLSALPMFYGRGKESIVKVFDSDIGEALDDRLEKNLRVRVLGRRLNLGFGGIYMAEKAIKTYEDLQGLNIRVPGGGADLARYLAFGATPRKIAVRDLADALRRKLVGGLLTTHNFVADGTLWDVGVRHAFLDNQVFYQYTPIINRTRWEALYDNERAWLSQSWEANVDDMRRIVEDRQAQSRAIAAQQGVTYVAVPEEQLQTMRATLLEEQPAIAAALEIDPQLIARAQALLADLDQKK